MAKQEGITLEKVESIAEKLRALPPVEKKNQVVSKQTAVAGLKSEISALQKRGYSLEQIAEILTGEGIAISTPTLKSYLQRVKGASKNAQKKASDSKVEKTLKKITDKATEAIAKGTFTPKPDSEEI